MILIAIVKIKGEAELHPENTIIKIVAQKLDKGWATLRISSYYSKLF